MDPLNAAMQNKQTMLSKNQDMKTRKFHILKKKQTKQPLAQLEHLGGEVIYQERDIKNDSQRPHFEEAHASGRMSVCLSEAYMCLCSNFKASA